VSVIKILRDYQKKKCTFSLLFYNIFKIILKHSKFFFLNLNLALKLGQDFFFVIFLEIFIDLNKKPHLAASESAKKKLFVTSPKLKIWIKNVLRPYSGGELAGC
jgi:hypothetical protein